MSDVKRPRLNAVEAAIQAIESIKSDGIAVYTTEKAELPSLVHLLGQNIRPGTGLVGTKDEEATRAEQQGNEPEVATGENPGEALETGSACTPGENEAESEEGEEEDLDGVEEDITDIVDLPDGGIMHVAEYFGSEYETRIRRLAAVKPMSCPPHMPTRPHDYQLKGAAQLTFLCESESRGGLLGDPMGLGKTLTTILHLYDIRKIPGQSLVLCPASLCGQWVKAIEEAFEDGHGLTAFHYADSRMSAHELRATGVDVIVASYETFENNMRAKLKTEEHVLEMAEKVEKEDASASATRKRPTCGLASDLGFYIYQPYKRLILDEVQNINKWHSVKHRAVTRISTRAVIGLSGTLPHNRWYDIGGYLDFLKGHPYTDEASFLAQFTRGSYDGSKRRPSAAAMSLLQRLFMAFTIIRPKNIIVLPPCRKVAFELMLPSHQAKHVEELTEKYRQAAQMASDEQVKIASGDTQTASALGCAIQAQIHQLHPGLTVAKEASYDPAQDLDNVTAEELNEIYAADHQPNQGERRSKWLAELNEWSFEHLTSSTQLVAIADLVEHISIRLGLKVVVFSQFLRYLDLVDKILQHRGVVAYRYDGSVATSKRAQIQTDFEAHNNSRPLLMTVGAGGIGLNLTAAKVMILCEELWNDNAVAQAISRLHRQGQEKEVLVLKFAIPNSAIDLEIIRTRETKVHVNADLLKPLIMRHDAEPVIPKLLY